MLTPLELIDKIAALVPPPRVHRHRYYGALVPNAPLRAAVPALAPVPVPAPAAGTPADAPHRAAARYLWAMLLARTPRVLPAGRIYEVFPLICPFCHAAMRIIAFIADNACSQHAWRTCGMIKRHTGLTNIGKDHEQRQSCNFLGQRHTSPRR